MGKKVGITAAGSTTQILTELMLRSAGVPQSAVSVEPLGSVAEEQAGFISGAINAYLVAPPGTSIALADHPGSKIVVQLGSLIPWVWAGLAAYMPYANSHKSVTVAVLRSLVEALKSWEHDPKGAEATLSKVGGTTSPAILQAAYADSLKVITTKPVPSATAEAFVLQTLSASQPKAKGAAPSKFFDDTYINEVLK